MHALSKEPAAEGVMVDVVAPGPVLDERELDGQPLPHSLAAAAVATTAQEVARRIVSLVIRGDAGGQVLVVAGAAA
jgi:short-subunit dehydrogenase